MEKKKKFKEKFDKKKKANQFKCKFQKKIEETIQRPTLEKINQKHTLLFKNVGRCDMEET